MLRSAIGQINVTVRRSKPTLAQPVLKCGFLSKLSPKKVVGLSAWQSRWFELTPVALKYWEIVVGAEFSGGPVVATATEKGSIPLLDMAGVKENKGKEASKRLDVLFVSKRLFQLLAPTTEDRDKWMVAIQQAMVTALSAKAEGLSLEGDDAGASAPAAERTSADVEASMREEEEEEVELEKGGAQDEASFKAMAPQSVKVVTDDGDEETAFWRM